MWNDSADMKKLLLTFIVAFTVTVAHSQTAQSPAIHTECVNNLLINGSFSSIEGVAVTAPGWIGSSSPDINDENGPLNTTSGYIWTGVPLASPDDSTWQNIFGIESIEQTVNIISGQPYTLCFEYAAQGISAGSLTFNGPVGLDVYINSVLSFTTPVDTSQFTWETACYTFTPSSSTVTIKFTPTYQQYIGIDGACLKQDVTGITDINQNSIFTIFPNPFSSSTTFQLNKDFKDATLSVYNSFGQEVYPSVIRNSDSFVISRGNLVAGIYFVELLNGNGRVVRKVAVQ